MVCTNLHNFKALNVLVGHDEGDRILSRVNDYLCTLSDSSWRTGGDEFVVVLRDELLSADSSSSLNTTTNSSPPVRQLLSERVQR